MKIVEPENPPFMALPKGNFNDPGPGGPPFGVHYTFTASSAGERRLLARPGTEQGGLRPVPAWPARFSSFQAGPGQALGHLDTACRPVLGPPATLGLEGACDWSHPRSESSFIPNFKTHDSGDFLITAFEPADNNNQDCRSNQRPWLYDLLESRDDP